AIRRYSRRTSTGGAILYRSIPEKAFIGPRMLGGACAGTRAYTHGPIHTGPCNPDRRLLIDPANLRPDFRTVVGLGRSRSTSSLFNVFDQKRFQRLYLFRMLLIYVLFFRRIPGKVK